jgi:hypothetical protein
MAKVVFLAALVLAIAASTLVLDLRQTTCGESPTVFQEDGSQCGNPLTLGVRGLRWRPS